MWFSYSLNFPLILTDFEERTEMLHVHQSYLSSLFWYWLFIHYNSFNKFPFPGETNTATFKGQIKLLEINVTLIQMWLKLQFMTYMREAIADLFE